MGLAKKSVGTFISKLAIFLLRFPTGVFIARFLGPEGKGLLHLLVTASHMCANLGSFGLGPASIYFIGKDPSRLPTMVGNVLLLTSAMCTLTAGAGWLLLQYDVLDTYARLPVWVWSILAVLIVLHLMRSLLMQVLSAILRIKEVNLLEVSAIGAQLILLVLCVGFLKGGVGGALLAVLLSETIAAVSFLTMVIRYGGRPATPNFRLLKASVRFGMKTQLANLMKLLNVRLDAFFIASLTANGIHAAGVYSVATGFAELLLFVPQSLRLSLFPMVAASKIAEANRLTSASCRQALLLTAIGALGFGTIGPFLIPRLYGAAFAGSVTPLLILLPGIVMESQVRILYGDLSGRGKPGVTMVSAAVALLVTVLLDLILIPTYGIIGAAIASSCAYAVEFIVAALFFVHYSSLKWRDILLLRSSDLYYYQKLFLKHL